MLKRWITAGLLLTTLFALGCAQPASNRETEVPSGMHLLTDGHSYLSRTEADQIEVTVVAHVFNGGTATCNSTSGRLVWPDELKARVLKESSWDGGVDPNKPGSRQRPYIRTRFNIAGLSIEQVKELLSQQSMTISCRNPEGYRNEITLTFEEGATPPPLQ